MSTRSSSWLLMRSSGATRSASVRFARLRAVESLDEQELALAHAVGDAELAGCLVPGRLVVRPGLLDRLELEHDVARTRLALQRLVLPAEHQDLRAVLGHHLARALGV